MNATRFLHRATVHLMVALMAFMSVALGVAEAAQKRGPGLPIIRANTLAEAAERAVAAWKNNANTVGLKVVNA